MTEITYPKGLSPRVIDIQLIGSTRSLTRSINGFVQLASASTKHWMVTYEFANLKKPEVQVFRAFVARMEGRLNYTNLPIWDKELGSDFVGLTTSHSDDTLFSDDSSYTSDGIINEVVTGTLGVKQLTVDFSELPGALKEGQYFGIEQQLYLCTEIISDVSNILTFRFEPSLRKSYTSADLRLCPVLQVRLSTDETGQLPLDLGITGAPVLSFEEYIG